LWTRSSVKTPTSRYAKKQQQASHQTSPVIHNLSKRELTDIEEKSLSRGLSYGIANKNINEFELLARYEVLANTLNDHKQKTTEPADKLQANQNNKSAFFQQLQTHMNNFIKNSKRIDNNLSRAKTPSTRNTIQRQEHHNKWS